MPSAVYKNRAKHLSSSPVERRVLLSAGQKANEMGGVPLLPLSVDLREDVSALTPYDADTYRVSLLVRPRLVWRFAHSSLRATLRSVRVDPRSLLLMDETALRQVLGYESGTNVAVLIAQPWRHPTLYRDVFDPTRRGPLPIQYATLTASAIYYPLEGSVVVPAAVLQEPMSTLHPLPNDEALQLAKSNGIVLPTEYYMHHGVWEMR